MKPTDDRDLAWLLGCVTCGRNFRGCCFRVDRPGHKLPPDGRCDSGLWVKNRPRFVKWFRVWWAYRERG